jgi:lysine 6-dehydrogenase
MRVAVIGCGRTGRGTAHALAVDGRVQQLRCYDVDGAVARGFAAWLSQLGSCAIDVAPTMDAALLNVDAAVICAPWPVVSSVIEVAATGLPLTSPTRPPNHASAGLRALPSASKVLLPIGLEPGITELMAGAVADCFEELSSMAIFCGGFPRIPRGPLGYGCAFGGERAAYLPIAPRSALMLRHGRAVETPRFSGCEPIRIDGVGDLEAYHDGMVSYLAEDQRFHQANVTQKTLRWPGFAATVRELERLGLLDNQPLEIDGAEVVPLRVVEKILARQTRAAAQEQDVVVVQVTGEGTRDGATASFQARMIAHGDASLPMSAMAQSTGLATAAATMALAVGELGGGGWLIPHRHKVLLDRIVDAARNLAVEWMPPTACSAQHLRGGAVDC